MESSVFEKLRGGSNAIWRGKNSCVQVDVNVVSCLLYGVLPTAGRSLCVHVSYEEV